MALPLLIDESSNYKLINYLINQIKPHGVRKASEQGSESGYLDPGLKSLVFPRTESG